jgi:hypothetical protein
MNKKVRKTEMKKEKYKTLEQSWFDEQLKKSVSKAIEDNEKMNFILKHNENLNKLLNL